MDKWYPARGCLAEGEVEAVVPSALFGKPCSFVWDCISTEERRRGMFVRREVTLWCVRYYD